MSSFSNVRYDLATGHYFLDWSGGVVECPNLDYALGTLEDSGFADAAGALRRARAEAIPHVTIRVSGRIDRPIQVSIG